MKKILTLVSRNIDTTIIRDAATKLTKVECDFDFVDNLSCVVESGKEPLVYLSAEPFPVYDLVFFRHWVKNKMFAVPVANMLHDKGYKIIEAATLSRTTTNKLDQMFSFSKLGLRVPKTMFVYRGQIADRLEHIEDHLSYPMIMKSSIGREGRDNYLVHNREDILRDVKDISEDAEVIFQEFIPNSFDYRFLVLGYKTAFVFKKSRLPELGSHVNNATQGSNIEVIPLDEVQELAAMAEKAAKRYSLEVCGVDIMISDVDGKPYILEANSSPGMKSFDQAEYLMRYLEEEAYKA